MLSARYANLVTNKDGALEIGIEYGTADLTNDQDSVRARELETGETVRLAPFNYENGWLFTGEHTQGEWFGGFNKFIAQYATGSMAAVGNNNTHSSQQRGGGLLRSSTSTAIQRSCRPSTICGESSTTGPWPWAVASRLMYAVWYESKKRNNATLADGQPATGSGGEKNWFSIGVRPIYKWSDTMNTALEIGYDNVNFDGGYAGYGLSAEDIENLEDGVTADDLRSCATLNDSCDLFKMTLAQQWQAGPSIWARPVIRLFVTYAEWNSGNFPQTPGIIPAEDTSGVTFGAQMEAWW